MMAVDMMAVNMTAEGKMAINMMAENINGYRHDCRRWHQKREQQTAGSTHDGSFYGGRYDV